MKNLKTGWRIFGAAVGFALLAFGLSMILKYTRPIQPAQPPTHTFTIPTVTLQPTLIPTPTTVESGYPYPPPNPEIYLPGKVRSLLENKAYLEGVDALVLDDQRAWIVTLDGTRQVGEFNDVAAVYGWNFDGSKVLIGRGLYDTMGELAKSTELWVYDLTTEKAYRLVDSTRIWSAAWSPVEDLIAYCEWGEIPTVSLVNSDGNLIKHRDEYIVSSFAWSPDGNAIALNISTPEMVVSDTRYSVLGIWWIAQNDLQLLSNATREDQYFPLWLIDGERILFTRLFGQGSEGGKAGLYIVDIKTLKMAPLLTGPKNIVTRIMRSPRSDTFVFWMGYYVYTLSLTEAPELLGEGKLPMWHPNGKTIYYSDDSKAFQTSILESSIEDKVIGGGISTSTIHLQPDLFFTQSKDK